MDDEQASLLGDVLEARIESGAAAEYLAEIQAEELPCYCGGKTSDCYLCKGTGVANRAGFEMETLKKVASFLRDCGGFTLH